MKYFLKKLWEGYQSEETYEECSKKWRQNLDDYNKQLEKLKIKLSNKQYEFFRHISLHDGSLLLINVFDENNIKIIDGNNRKKDIEYPISVNLEILNSEETIIYTLKYTNVKSIDLNYPTEQPLFIYSYGGFGDWGYDELTEFDDEFFSHEILFSSGAVLKILFKNIIIETRQI